MSFVLLLDALACCLCWLTSLVWCFLSYFSICSLFWTSEKYLEFLRKRMNTNPSHGPYHFRAPSRILFRTVRGKEMLNICNLTQPNWGLKKEDNTWHEIWLEWHCGGKSCIHSNPGLVSETSVSYPQLSRYSNFLIIPTCSIYSDTFTASFFLCSK